MILATLSVRHFRSYHKQAFSFTPGTTIIVGKNTAGKTNILEAIYFLATGKSFRADRDNESVAWNEEMATVKGDMVNGDGLELRITTGAVQGIKTPIKKYLVNGVPRRSMDFVGNMRAVLFWPEDLDLITGSPSKRRKYLDHVLIQVDREYRRTLGSYERAVRQRNKLLFLIHEGKAARSQLLFWDQLLIKAGNYITDARANLIDFVNSFQLSDVSYRLEYDKSVISEARLAQYADAEVGAKVTLVGPHRDDFVVMKRQGTRDKGQGDLKDVSKYGSRGEQRLAVLWLKLAELSYIEKEAGVRPMLLLDDIFSELDPAHRELVFRLIAQQQTILTTAEPEVVELVKTTLPEAPVIVQLPL